jgi:hypothetical protein
LVASQIWLDLGVPDWIGYKDMNALLIYPEWPDTYWSFKHALPF